MFISPARRRRRGLLSPDGGAKPSPLAKAAEAATATRAALAARTNADAEPPKAPRRAEFEAARRRDARRRAARRGRGSERAAAISATLGPERSTRAGAADGGLRGVSEDRGGTGCNAAARGRRAGQAGGAHARRPAALAPRARVAASYAIIARSSGRIAAPPRGATWLFRGQPNAATDDRDDELFAGRLGRLRQRGPAWSGRVP